jgi:hypothetical protein
MWCPHGQCYARERYLAEQRCSHRAQPPVGARKSKERDRDWTHDPSGVKGFEIAGTLDLGLLGPFATFLRQAVYLPTSRGLSANLTISSRGKIHVGIACRLRPFLVVLILVAILLHAGEINGPLPVQKSRQHRPIADAPASPAARHCCWRHYLQRPRRHIARPSRDT